jgi:arabinofuranosyltransferase
VRRSAATAETLAADTTWSAWRPLLLVAVTVFFITVVRTAWLSDDAFITLRAVDNFVSGFGPRWNPAERVQAFTHPLWFLLLSAAYAVTREAYFTTLALGFACTTGAVLVLIRGVAPTPSAALVGLALVASSKAFVDFSTSGLENPLGHLLVIAFFAHYFRRAATSPATQAALLASVILLNRPESGVLVLPALAAVAYRRGWRKGVLEVGVGLLPLAAWELFSLAYYGFLVPNTAYAKLNTGIERSELIRQGFVYLRDSLAQDPVTLPAIVFAALLAAWRRWWLVSAGLALSLLVVLLVGGDFMSGRFLTPAFAMAVSFLCREAGSLSRRAAPATTVGIVGLGLCGPAPALLGQVGTASPPGIPASGIVDERRYYAEATGLLRYSRQVPSPRTDEPYRVRRYLSEGRTVVLRDAVGFFGFYAGRRLHIVDVLGLGDPLIARLPSERPWRIGHFYRRVPAGYEATLQSGQNRIEDPGVAAYYDDLMLVVRGPIWSARRWAAIWRLNTGATRHLLDGHVRGPVGEVRP